MDKRNKKLDYLRGIAILVVLLGHSLQVYYSILPKFGTMLFEFIQYFQMPLLMAISGFTFSFSFGKRSLLYNIKNKTMRLLLPYFVWATVNYFISILLDSGTEIGLGSYIYNILTSQFWFLRHLYCYSVIIIIIEYITTLVNAKHRKVIFSCGIVFSVVLVAILSNIPVLNASFSLWYYCMLVLGMLVGLNRDLFNTSIQRISLKQYYVITVVLFCLSFIGGNDKIVGLFFIIVLVNTILIIPSKNLEGKMQKRIIDIGSKTLYIYAIHWILGFKILQLTGVVNCIKEDNVLICMGLIIITFSFFLLESLLLGNLLDRNVTIRNLFLGKK